jgi:hypothetical protein
MSKLFQAGLFDDFFSFRSACATPAEKDLPQVRTAARTFPTEGRVLPLQLECKVQQRPPLFIRDLRRLLQLVDIILLHFQGRQIHRSEILDSVEPLIGTSTGAREAIRHGWGSCTGSHAPGNFASRRRVRSSVR